MSRIQYKNGRLNHTGEGFTCSFSEAKKKTRLGGKTYKNLEIFTEAFGIEWKECYVVEIERSNRYRGTTDTVHSVCIVGSIGEDTIEYLRKETRAKGAGSTIVCLEGKHRVKATSLLELCKALKDGKTSKHVMGKLTKEANKRDKQNQRVFSDEMLTALTSSMSDENVGLLILDDNKIMRKMGKMISDEER